MIPSAVQGPDIFQLLNAKAPTSEAPRTDVYICVTDDVGVKWRDEKTLEFKVRMQVNESIGCELWNKVYICILVILLTAINRLLKVTFCRSITVILNKLQILIK